MPKGVYAAASAMVTEQRALDVTANNMANVNSAGFRRGEAMRMSFANQLAQEQARHGGLAGDGAAGVHEDGVYRAQVQGNINRSDRPTDMAISGDGFFHFQDGQGQTVLSRDGGFSLDDGGFLVNDQGWRLQGQGGDIQLPEGRVGVTVDEAGRVYAQFAEGAGVVPRFVDQIRVSNVEQPESMQPLSGQHFSPGNQSVVDAEGYRIDQYMIEQSTVDPVEELVNMVAIQRRYDAAQRSMKAFLDSRGFSDVLRGVS